MVKGLYTAHTGMINEQKRLDIISNNIANAATIGYKKESVTNQAFDEVLTLKINDSSEAYLNRPIGTMSLGVKIGEAYTDYKQGSLRQTGNTYDLAIEGEGFFTINVVNKNGVESEKYTRDGCFKMTKDGFIVDSSGNKLVGESGVIQIPADTAKVKVSVDGTVFADGNIVNRVKITDFEDYDYIEKYGEKMYEAVNGAVKKESPYIIQQGFTEQSNVNAISEMVELIAITRAYEANQKSIQTVDGMIDLAVNSVGRV